MPKNASTQLRSQVLHSCICMKYFRRACAAVIFCLQFKSLFMYRPRITLELYNISYYNALQAMFEFVKLADYLPLN